MVQLYVTLAVIADVPLSYLRQLDRRLRDGERGATAVEYGLMVALIAGVIIGAVSLFGGRIQEIFQDTCESVTSGTATTSKCKP